MRHRGVKQLPKITQQVRSRLSPDLPLFNHKAGVPCPQCLHAENNGKQLGSLQVGGPGKKEPSTEMGVSATTKAAHCPWGLRSVSVVNLFVMLGLTCHLHPSPRFRLFLLPCPKSQGVSIPAPFAVGWGAWPSPWAHRLGSLSSPPVWPQCGQGGDSVPRQPCAGDSPSEHTPCPAEEGPLCRLGNRSSLQAEPGF